jgi:hypothetical protein
MIITRILLQVWSTAQKEGAWRPATKEEASSALSGFGM